jgi:hypothetical protein
MIEAIDARSEEYLHKVNEMSRLEPEIRPNFAPLAVADLQERARQLRELNLPAEPDAERHPGLHAFWSELFATGTTYLNGELEYTEAPFQRKVSPPRRVTPSSRMQSSGNWSGASVTARDGLMLTDVTTRFRVPTVKVPAANLNGSPNPEADTYESSCWIGLDGQRAYIDSTLPQMGTEQSINKQGRKAGRAAIAWFQWWPMDEMTIVPLDVEPEDRVYCWLTATSFTSVRCVMKVGEGARGRLVRFSAPAPTVRFTEPLIPKYQACISGATAEWITEAPTDVANNRPFTVPDFHQVTFDHCYALAAPEPRAAPDAPYRLERLNAPKILEMYAIVGTPPRRVTISTARRPKERPELDVIETRFLR